MRRLCRRREIIETGQAHAIIRILPLFCGKPRSFPPIQAAPTGWPQTHQAA